LELDWKIAIRISGKSNSKRLLFKYEKHHERRNQMKKGILTIISLAFAVFILSAIGLTISTVSGMQSAQSAVIENSTPFPVVEISTQVPQKPAITTAINETTAISTAQADAGIATLSSTKADLVDLNGKTAYEVLFDFGKVYIDANTGLVLGNSIVVTPEIAGSVAANYLQLNRYNQVSQVSLKGENVYKVSFLQGVNVYVNMKGVVITWEYAPSYNVNPNTAPGTNPNPQPNNPENDD
jgi:uncharacterized membrane protein YkoI